MRRMVVVDDFDHTQLADTTVYIGLNGTWVQLDLTDEHSDDLARLLRPWVEAGETVGEELVHKKTPKSHATAKSTVNQSRGRDWNIGFRVWADENGRSYRTPKGGFYASVRDAGDYDAYLQSLTAEGNDDGARQATA